MTPVRSNPIIADSRRLLIEASFVQLQPRNVLAELLPVWWTPRLGCLAKSEGADGAATVQPGVQGGGGPVGQEAWGFGGAGQLGPGRGREHPATLDPGGDLGSWASLSGSLPAQAGVAGDRPAAA